MAGRTRRTGGRRRIAIVAALLGGGMVAALAAGGPGERAAVSVVRAAADGAEVWLADKPVHGPATVSDGDTLRIGAIKVRLFAIDAPELSQTCGDWPCGAAAAERLRALVAAGPATCLPRDRDRYGRIVAVCTVAGIDLGARLVDEGLARAYLPYGDDYAGAEARARTERIGLWRGSAEAPWDYRARQAAGHAASASRHPAYDPLAGGGGGPGKAADAGGGDCPIKGNVSAGGNRIYHLPGTRDYARTRIDPARGEAWFCDEAAARAAGFRPPAR